MLVPIRLLKASFFCSMPQRAATAVGAVGASGGNWQPQREREREQQLLLPPLPSGTGTRHFFKSRYEPNFGSNNTIHLMTQGGQEATFNC